MLVNWLLKWPLLNMKPYCYCISVVNIVSSTLDILPCDLSIPPWHPQLVESQTRHSDLSRRPAKQKLLEYNYKTFKRFNIVTRFYVNEWNHLHGECPSDADYDQLLVMINADEERSLSHIHMKCCKHQVCILLLQHLIADVRLIYFTSLFCTCLSVAMFQLQQLSSTTTTLQLGGTQGQALAGHAGGQIECWLTHRHCFVLEYVHWPPICCQSIMHEMQSVQ